jgi:hypothetical protein
MHVSVWSDSVDRWHMLFTTDDRLPKKAVPLAKGEWVLEREIPDFNPAGRPLGIDGERAGQDLEHHGYHECSVKMTVG